MRRLWLIPAALNLLVAVLGSKAESGGSSVPVSYDLTKSSSAEIGCRAPCACPVLLRGPLTGSFTLTFAGSDGLFDTYEVTGVDWQIQGDPPLHYRGSGTYRVGGKFASQHQMTLTLNVDGQTPQQFDSGLIVGGGTFPLIEIPVAANAFFCYDTVLTVDAVPAVAGTTPDLGFTLTLDGPNPFRASIGFTFTHAASGPVNLAVYDLQGRVVRQLIESHEVEPGGPGRAP